MKLLWVKTDFLHPTNRGGQVRSLKMLEVLHRRHEVHYLTYHDPDNSEGPARAGEYCRRAWPVTRRIPHRRSLEFGLQLIGNLVSPLPLVITRYRSEAMACEYARLCAAEHYDCVVCDFLFPAPNLEPLEQCIIFQHNVESLIWRRYVEQARDPLRRAYLRVQYQRLWNYERDACRRAAHVVAVSETDAAIFSREFGITRVSAIPTGVDIDYYTPPKPSPSEHDLAFVGSMDWLPNIDGVNWFLDEVLPLIHRKRPQTSVIVIGRNPAASLRDRAKADSRIRVTGTVDDVRPHLWNAAISIVPLRVGSGTRLKIYEAMAARRPVISTSIGVEGLTCDDGTIRIADAAECLALLDDRAGRETVAANAWNMVNARCSWDHVARQFETILEGVAR